MLPSLTVQDLPVLTRNYVDLIAISAGVAPIGAGNSPASTWTGTGTAGQGSVTASIAGSRESNESFLVDGIESRNARFGSANLRPSFDSIQEVNVQTNNFSAENGRSSGLINTTLKSGTNAFHGDVFDYLRNDFFDAPNFFLTLNHQPQNKVRYNDFGGSIGGPVILPFYNGSNKTFFFFNYKGIRNPRIQTLTANNPSAAQLAGNLADNSEGTGLFPTSTPFCVANPMSSHCVNVIDPTTGQSFPGNVIPTNRLDPIAQKWRQFWPAGNVANPTINPISGFPTYNYSVQARGFANWDQYNTRIDHTLSSSDQIWGSYTHDNRPTLQPGAEPLSGTDWPLSDDLAMLTETHTFAPNIVNEFRFGYNRGRTYEVGQGALTQNYAANIFGLKNTSPNPFDFGVPDAGIALFSSPGSPGESIGALDQNVQGVDNLSLVRGKHNIKVGVNYIREKFSQITDFSGVPNMSFSGQYTHAGLGDFLLGDPSYASASVGDSSQDLRTYYLAEFVQDDWHVLHNLTLNLGLRYEYQQSPWDKKDRTAWFDPTVKNVVYSDLGQVRNGVVAPDRNNFAPRVGFAYSPTSKTVLRGGGGIFYATDNWNELQFLVVQPRYYATQSFNGNPTTPSLSLESLFPQAQLGGGTSTPFSIDKFNRTPYIEQWNLDLQETFAKDWLLDIGYLGNTSHKLPQRRNQNAPSFDPTGTIPIQDRVPYKTYSWILEDYTEGWSSYNGLVAKVEKRFSNGLYVLGSYTYSHALDDGITDDTSLTSTDLRLDKGNSDYDVRHRFVASYSYELPFGRGKTFLGGISRGVDRLVGGWQVSGITTMSTGQFSTPSLPVDWMDQGAFSNSVPNRIGNPYQSRHTYQNWWNIGAFSVPGCPDYNIVGFACDNGSPGVHLEGNAGRNSLENPGFDNWDLSIMKHTPITERLNTEFRVEAYNVWNHPQLGNASTTLLPGQFGVIGYLRQDPRVLQLALKLMF